MRDEPTDDAERVAGTGAGGTPPRALATGALLDALRDAGVAFAPTRDERDEHARDWWPLSIPGVARGHVPAWPGVVVRPTSTERGRRVLARRRRDTRPGHGPGRALERRRRRGRPSRARSRSTSRDWTASSTSTRSRAPSASRRASSDRTSSGRSRPRAAPSATSPSPSSSRRSAAGSPAAAPASTRIATARSRTSCAGSPSCWRTASVVEPADGLRARRSGRTSRSCSSAPRARSGSSRERPRRARRCPPRARAAYGFDELRRRPRRVSSRPAARCAPGGAAPLRRDRVARSFDVEGCALIVLDEGDARLVDATMAIVDEECATATELDDARGDVARAPQRRGRPGAALGARRRRRHDRGRGQLGARCTRCVTAVIDALGAMPGITVASVHQSHAYLDGACLYFTFAGRPDDDGRLLPRAWDGATHEVLAAGGALSHHHGVGRNRARFVADALGAARSACSRH